MPTATGIELGPDSCVLAGVRTGRRGPAIFALHVIERGEWPGHDVALSGLLRSVRRNRKLPRTARVVAWGFHEGAHAKDPVTSAALRPVVEAGFRIDTVLSPPQALARLAAGRPRSGDGAAAWLALNMSGVAIAIVRGGELLFERTFDWSFTPAADARTELLQRYSLVSHLAPEVQRGIAMVKASHGIGVDTAITCGDLPDLRSLTMPLIEELDLEVETLDSIEGFRVTGAAKSDRLGEFAPAIRLACAAAMAPSQRRGVTPLAGVAAGVVLLAGLGWASYTYWAPVPRSSSKVAAPAPAVKAEPPPSTSVSPAPPRRSATPIPAAASPSPVVPPPAPVVTATPAPPASVSAASPPVVTAPAPVVPAPPPATPAPSPSVAAPLTVPGARQPQQVQRSPTDTSRGSPVAAPTPRARLPRPVPLRAPLPVIDSILVDASRRLAVIGGTIVSVGDSVGPRTVTQIERDFVILSEPSGLEVRVPIRGRMSKLVS